MEIGFRSDIYEHFMLEKGLQLVDWQLGTFIMTCKSVKVCEHLMNDEK